MYGQFQATYKHTIIVFYIQPLIVLVYMLLLNTNELNCNFHSCLDLNKEERQIVTLTNCTKIRPKCSRYECYRCVLMMSFGVRHSMIGNGEWSLGFRPQCTSINCDI